jgi:hypothetical protein
MCIICGPGSIFFVVVHAMSTAVAGTFRGQTNEGVVLEIEWHNSWARVTTNANGVTGWATVLSTSTGFIKQGDKDTAVAVGTVLRFHRCAFSPCTARHPDSKYGVYGPPAHLRPLVDGVHPPTASTSVVEVLPAVDTPVPIILQPLTAPASLDVQDIVVVCPPVVISPPVSVDSIVLSPSHASPDAAALRCVSAAEAAPPMLLSHQVSLSVPPCSTAVAASIEISAVAVAIGESDVLDTILHLARSIRQSCHYVGYSFFVLYGLAKKRCPMIWEGGNKINLIETFVPWASEDCSRSCMVEGISCCFEETDEHAIMCPVSEAHPLNSCKHFVACIVVPPGGDSGGSSIESFYHHLGLAILGTVMDGDCGLDVACQMEGLCQTVENRTQLREDYLILLPY